METVLRIIGTAGLAGTTFVLWRSRRALRPTTLLPAWYWATFALALWWLSWIVTNLTDLAGPAVADQLWYMTAVISICPAIAALGARRPGIRVWATFVIAPLVLVLGWPTLTAWDSEFHLQPLQLEVPAVAGYALVMLMGLGNYLGTRFWPTTVLLCAALLLLVAPFSTAVPDAFPTREDARPWATLCLSLAVLAAWIRRKSRAQHQPGFVALWLDFRDWFGLVWSKRIQERINHAARQENWPLRLENDGPVWTDPALDAAKRAETEQRLDHSFRWLLRRFVDPEWIDARLK